MIEPSIGHKVWYWPTDDDHPFANNDAHLELEKRQPMAATIAYVFNNHRVNLSIIDHNGVQFGKTSVYLAQDDDIVAAGMCQWMPYQIGQAAKTEELKKQLEDDVPQGMPEEHQLTSEKVSEHATADGDSSENETTG